MKYLLIAVVSLLLGGCAGTNLGSATAALPKTLAQACDFYQRVRPRVIAYHDWAKTNWDATVPGTNVPVISEEEKKLLVELDGYLPKLDEAGKDLCALSYAVNLAAETGSRPKLSGGLKNVDWDQVLSVTLKVASTAAQLKAQGAF